MGSLLILGNGKLMITPNHVYAGSNKMDLTKDTIYNHPTSKQCSGGDCATLSGHSYTDIANLISSGSYHQIYDTGNKTLTWSKTDTKVEFVSAANMRNLFNLITAFAVVKIEYTILNTSLQYGTEDKPVRLFSGTSMSSNCEVFSTTRVDSRYINDTSSLQLFYCKFINFNFLNQYFRLYKPDYGNYITRDDPLTAELITYGNDNLSCTFQLRLRMTVAGI